VWYHLVTAALTQPCSNRATWSNHLWCHRCFPGFVRQQRWGRRGVPIICTPHGISKQHLTTWKEFYFEHLNSKAAAIRTPYPKPIHITRVNKNVPFSKVRFKKLGSVKRFAPEPPPKLQSTHSSLTSE
jgi:hypothetical protein